MSELPARRSERGDRRADENASAEISVLPCLTVTGVLLSAKAFRLGKEVVKHNDSMVVR